MGDLINLVEILREKERDKQQKEELEKAELRSQLQWILKQLHEKNIPYHEEDESIADEPQRESWIRQIMKRIEFLKEPNE